MNTFWRRVTFSDNDKHHLTPLWRFYDSGSVYKCHDLLTCTSLLTWSNWSHPRRTRYHSQM